MLKETLKGTAIAAAVVSICSMGIATVGHAADKSAKVKCDGGSSCKGTGSCKSAENSCKGQNGCKGKGWTMEKSKEECEKKGGKVAQ